MKTRFLIIVNQQRLGTRAKPGLLAVESGTGIRTRREARGAVE